jgi:hypothetical protein
MNAWQVEETSEGLKLSRPTRRTFGSERFTWADLLYRKLASVKVYVIYFPSRFNLDMDAAVIKALRTFGENTGPSTSVNFWDPIDPEFGKALELFHLQSPPALVLATGLKVQGIEPFGPDKANLYTITITNREVLSNQEQLAAAVNTSHDILVRGNPKEITSYLRKNAIQSLLEVIARVAGDVRDEILKCKPKFTLPNGISIQVGG